MSYWLAEKIMSLLVRELSPKTTLTAGQIKEISPIIVGVFQRKIDNHMDENTQHSYERIKDYIQKQFPNAYQDASNECQEVNSFSEPVILINTIEKITGGIDQAPEENKQGII